MPDGLYRMTIELNVVKIIDRIDEEIAVAH